MINQKDKIPLPEEYETHLVSLLITTYELVEKVPRPTSPIENPYIWKETLTHIFHGETEERAYQISEAHKLTDAFYKASFEGRFPWKGGIIVLKNSEFKIIK